ncbi:MAG: trigger factor [Bacteroidetes bacterium]|nr:trigger factor [Bacteroidota bacterium]
MATITREPIGELHEKVTLRLEKSDYLPAFERSLKDYGKKANIPGFRKGMVPVGLIKKMYGPSVFTDEVLRTVDRELIGYLQTEKLEIFAQPLPLETDMRQLDVNNPLDYTFHFEIGRKPDFQLTDLGKAKITRYVIEVTDEMIDQEITRLQNRYGNMKDQEVVDNEEQVLNVQFTETDAQGEPIENGTQKDNSLLVKYFASSFRDQWMGKKVGDSLVNTLASAFEEKERSWIVSDLGLPADDASALDKNFRITLTKIGLLEKRALDESLFEQLYPNQEVKTEADFRNKIREEIGAYWTAQSNNQIQDQVFHALVDHTTIPFPEGFLKKWLQTQGENPKSAEEVEKEFPTFCNQLKWTLISEKIVKDQALQVNPDEIRAFAQQQLFSNMGGANLGMDQPWVSEYTERMMKDRKYVEDAYHRIQSQKVMEWGATQINPTDTSIEAEKFTQLVEEYRHHHH